MAVGRKHFTLGLAELGTLLADVRHLQGRLLGRMEAIGFNLRAEATLETLASDVVKTSEIEGETLDTKSGAFITCAPFGDGYC